MINTNGFKQLLEQSLLEEQGIEFQKDNLQKLLSPFYEALEALKDKYNFDKLQSEVVDLNHRASVQESKTDYFRFRILIDGLYNLLAIYGHDYCGALFRWLKINYAVDIYGAQNRFARLYNDDICLLDPEDGCTGRVYMAHELTGIRYASSDYDFSIEFPVVTDLDAVLLAAQDFLRQLTVENQKAKEEKEYEEYLRLKEKFGNK